MDLNPNPNVFEGGDLARQRDLNLARPVQPGFGRGSLLWEHAVRVLRKNARFSLIVAGVVILSAAGMSLYLNDEYQATGRLQVDPVDNGIKTLHEIQDNNAAPDQDYQETQVQVLQSDGLATRVIRALHLDRQKEFAPANLLASTGQHQGADRTVAALPVDEDYLREQLELADRSPAESAALIAFHRHLTVNPVRNSHLIEVSYESRDPHLAQLITNTLMSQFLEQSYRDRFTTTTQASEWLSAQLDDLRRKVDASSRAVVEYQKRYGIVEEGDHDVPLTQFMAEVNRQASDAQAERIEAEASVRMIDSGNQDGIPALRDDIVFQGLLTQYAEARSGLAQARAVYGDENSNVKKLVNQTAELESQIREERNRVVARLRASLDAAQAREQMTVQSREKVRNEMGAVNSHLVEYSVLRSEAAASAELYNTLQARLKEAGIYAGLRSSNIRVVDMAPKLDKPTGPARKLILAFGTLLGCVLAVGAAFVRESFDNTLRTPDDIRHWAGLPSLAVVPTITPTALQASLPDAEHRLGPSPEFKNLTSFPRIDWTRLPNAAAEALRGLRTTLLSSRAGVRPRVILVSSASAGEGKTTVAINLASVLAQRAQVCIVDADFRRPTVASALGVLNSKGLGNVLNGEPIEDALIPVPGIPGLTLLSGVSDAENPADFFASGNWKALITVLKTRFDFVILDSPPLIPFSDARLLAPVSDAVVLVGRYGITTRTALARCAQLLQDVQSSPIGVVLNDMDFASPDYHYYNYGFSRAQNYDPYESYGRTYPALASGNSPHSGGKARGTHA